MAEYIFQPENNSSSLTSGIEDMCALLPNDWYGTIHSEIVRCRDCKHFTYADTAHMGNDWCAKHDHIGWSVNGFCAWNARAEQGSEPPYDELLRCLENDWHISASWDGLRKFWCVELTEEGVRMRDAMHGTLTAEQVREAVMSADRWEKPMGNTGLTNTHLIIRDDGWQAIADELNARAERTCQRFWTGAEMICSSCAYQLNNGAARYCPNCGAKVVDE